MPYVNVPNDLSKIKTKIAFNLTRRQLICFGGAAAVGIPVYLLTRHALGGTGAMFLMIALMLPAFFVAMYERDGLPFEKVARNIIRAKFLRPGVRPYQTQNMSVGNPTGVQYLRCSKRADSKSCDGCGTLRTREFERFLYGEMVKKLSEFQTLTAKRETVNPKLTALNMELARVEDEIEKLLNTLTGANAVLLSYANSKIEELDTRRQALTKEIAALSAEIMSPEQIERLSVYLNQWEEIDFEDRRQVADGLISQIRATDEHVSIEWKI